jgi:AcrR family transcriptional regulator
VLTTAEAAERPAGRSEATRSALLDVAAELFAERGYGNTAVRDVAWRAKLTSGAIYGHFRNKADLLVEAIEHRIADELDAQCELVKRRSSHVEALAAIARQYRSRRRLRALMLQGAVAAQTDEETRQKLRSLHRSHLQAWIAEYEANRERLGIDPALDLQAAVLYTWAAEVGLGVLEVFGITPERVDGWVDMSARVGRAFRLPQAEAVNSKAKG